jgi:Protein of unknown function, DUF485
MDPQQIQDLPAFRRLASERTRFGTGMSIGMAAAYFSYILTIAFWPRLLGLPLWNGTVITWGFHRRRTHRARVRADSRLRRAGELPLRSSQPTSS